jgi:hypothetical protein
MKEIFINDRDFLNIEFLLGEAIVITRSGRQKTRHATAAGI